MNGWPSFPDELPRFHPADAPDEPHELFLGWLADAGEHLLAPHAPVLSTVDSDGAPDARVVILRGADAAGFWFSTSADSPKGGQLGAEPRAALTFFWPGRGRQVRVRGPAAPGPAEESAADFARRSPASRAEVLIGHQSEVLADPAELTAAAAAAAERVRADPERPPPGWTRYLLTPHTVEFWQASHDRLHVRLRYRRLPGQPDWTRERLWP